MQDTSPSNFRSTLQQSRRALFLLLSLCVWNIVTQTNGTVIKVATDCIWYAVHLSAVNDMSKNSLSKDSYFRFFFSLFIYKQQICFSVSYKDTYGQVIDDSYFKKSRKTHLQCAFKTDYNDERVEKLKKVLLYQGGPNTYINPHRKETVSTQRNFPLTSAVRYIQARRRVSQKRFLDRRT